MSKNKGRGRKKNTEPSDLADGPANGSPFEPVTGHSFASATEKIAEEQIHTTESEEAMVASELADEAGETVGTESVEVQESRNPTGENNEAFVASADEETESEEDEVTEGEAIEESISHLEEEVAFLPGELDEQIEELAAAEVTPLAPVVDVEGTELGSFEAADIEETEFIEDERVESIIESILFASDRPVGLGALKLVFKGTNVTNDKIKRTLDRLAVEYAGAVRGVTLEEVPGGWQIRTKIDNMEFLRRTLKTRSFRLSGPALEVLSICAYKQPVVKNEIDEIRGVESGHLLRALMEKGLVNFGGKSDLPGRPMTYETTRKFLEIFGLRNLKELPTLSQIDELLPEGIDEVDAKKQTLADVTSSMSEDIQTGSFSAGEEELNKITDQLEQITTSSDFFEQEKRRQREVRDRDRAENLRDALNVGELIATRDVNWLKKYDEALAQGTTLAALEDEARKARFANIREAGDAAPGVETTGATVPESETSLVAMPGESPAGETEGHESFEEGGLFEEEAPHPEDELPMEAADIDGDDDLDHEGEAGL